jgi:hypothetical protein
MWGALSDERTDLYFTIAVQPCLAPESHGTNYHILLSQI